MADHLADELSSAVGEQHAQWWVAILVFVSLVWARVAIGQASPGSYSPDVLAHLWEGAAVGVPAGIGTKRLLNKFSPSTDQSRESQ